MWLQVLDKGGDGRGAAAKVWGKGGGGGCTKGEGLGGRAARVWEV